MRKDRFKSPDERKARYRKDLPNFASMVNKHGADWFNRFRHLNPDCEIDFKGRGIGTNRLRGIDLSGIDISGMNLFGSDLTGAHLTGAKCHGTIFDRATLDGATLMEADLTNASFRDASLDKTTMQWAILKGVCIDENFAQARLAGADLRGIASGSRLPPDADLQGCKLDGLHLGTQDLRGTDLTNASLEDANMCGARFNFETELVRAKLAGARMYQRDFDEANTRGAILFKWDPDAHRHKRLELID